MDKNCYKYLIISALFTLPILAQDGVVVITKSDEIDRVLALKKEVNQTESFIKIQIYNGNRLEAENTLLSYKTDSPDQFIEMKYETPNYKVWVGRFRTRLEADRELVKVKKKFPNAFLFTP
tara:strand:+ start:806 stop:1168 length:363 start_codon:yes stop_codon:yes gene_type:complete